MIVNALKDGWEIYYQRTHALAAAALIAPWQPAQRPDRWLETLIATAQHDDQEGFWSAESHHLTDIGGPMDFMAQTNSQNYRQAVWVIDNAAQQSAYIALLISMHNVSLYAQAAEDDADMRAFIEEQQRLQTNWRKALGLNKTEAERCYRFLRFGDQLSLILCRRELPIDERWLDVTAGPDGEVIRVMQRADDDTILLDPWPYEVGTLTVTAECRRLGQLHFASEDEYRAAVMGAPVQVRAWTLRR